MWMFSKDTGFKPIEAGDTIPDNAITVTDAEHTQLLSAQAKGAKIAQVDDQMRALSPNGEVIDLSLDGAVTSYLSGSPASLKARAEVALSEAQTYCMNEYVLVNDPTPDSWSLYVKALRAITRGVDTTSTTLPISPLVSEAGDTNPSLTTALLKLETILVSKQESGFYYTPVGTAQTIMFSTSVKAQTQYQAARTLAQTDATKTFDFEEASGEPITLSAADAIAMTQKVAQYVMDCYSRYRVLFNLIVSGKDPDITTGWPNNE